MTLRILCVGALFFVSLLPVLVRADDAADEKRYTTVKLLDTSVPQAEREATLAHFKQMALSGNTYAQYVVGSLYRIGDKLAGNLVPLDLDQAQKYLSTAAAHGYLRAMPKMSEIELAQKHYLEAMIWAQLFGYYAGLNGADSKTIKDSAAAGYLADLIKRITDRLDEKQMPTVLDDMKAVIAQHDADIRKGMAGPKSFGPPMPSMQPRTSSKRHMVAPPHPSGSEFKDVLADYLIGFDAKGDASDAWLIDAVPDITLGKALKTVALSTEVNPIEGGSTEPRYALQPINFSWGRYSLRKAN